MADKTTIWKLSGAVAGTIFTVIGGVIGIIHYLDNSYVTPDQLTAKLSTINNEISQLKTDNIHMAKQFNFLHRQLLQDQVRDIKREQYKIKSLMDAGKASESDSERYRDLDFALQDIQQRLNSIN